MSAEPAIAAAAREWAKHKTIPFEPDSLYGQQLISTAREALRPIEEWYWDLNASWTDLLPLITSDEREFR